MTNDTEGGKMLWKKAEHVKGMRNGRRVKAGEQVAILE